MKRLIAVLLLLILMTSFASCAEEMRPEPLNAAGVRYVTASTAIYSNYLYVIEDTDAIAELVALYNGLRYVPTDEVSFADLLGGTLYRISYERDDPGNAERPTLACAWISPEGYVYFTDYDHEDDPDAVMPVYRLTSDFDEAWLKEILETNDIMQEPVI